jgi:NAD(P)-dependent dehydrogenase (short-subunit alcohol dehydrogenase family)
MTIWSTTRGAVSSAQSKRYPTPRRERFSTSTSSACSPSPAPDLSAADGPAQLIQRAIEEHGQVDVLVNNVGAVRMRTEGFLGTSDEDFAWAMQMNFFIALRASRAALTAMAARGAGAIVNVASVNVFFQPDAATIDYGAAKAALVNLTKTLAQEFGPRGIRVKRCVTRSRVNRPVARRARRSRDRGEVDWRGR